MLRDRQDVTPKTMRGRGANLGRKLASGNRLRRIGGYIPGGAIRETENEYDR
jgi:hypothetical protein